MTLQDADGLDVFCLDADLDLPKRGPKTAPAVIGRESPTMSVPSPSGNCCWG
ncbi:MAG: hypothetical protein R3B91_07655 [Planctomycetaceae bacterium]